MNHGFRTLAPASIITLEAEDTCIFSRGGLLGRGASQIGMSSLRALAPLVRQAVRAEPQFARGLRTSVEARSAPKGYHYVSIPWQHAHIVASAAPRRSTWRLCIAKCAIQYVNKRLKHLARALAR